MTNAAFRPVPWLVLDHADRRPAATALVHADERWSFAQLAQTMRAVASALQRDGLAAGDRVALAGTMTPRMAAATLGILLAGCVVVPLPSSATAGGFASLLADSGARLLLLDAGAPWWPGKATADDADPLPTALPQPACVALGPGVPGTAWHDWLGDVDAARPLPVDIGPEHPFNIIYSSGTTGVPKGIVQPHGMRFGHVQRGAGLGYGVDSRTLLSTPLYSNTTLVSFYPAIALGGEVHLMPKFDAGRWLAWAERERITHTMLVPVQYRRLLAHPDLDRRDLSALQAKFVTSAPFDAADKRAVLDRIPGGLVEFYGMTEGGGTCILAAHLHPDKLHTVGRPSEGHDIRLIDEDGRELPAGDPAATGEVVGRSGAMMVGYFGRPDATAGAEWFSPNGERFIRTGDIGRFDADGFLQLLDRRKDMLISGGFNIYPSDLESVLRRHPQVADASVVGVPSPEWGETPEAHVELRAGESVDAEALRAWANERLGRTQRIHRVVLHAALPRNAIGKVLKRELRDGPRDGSPRSMPPPTDTSP